MGEKFRNDATEPSSLRAWFQLSNFGLRDTPASADFVSQQFFSLDHFSYCVGRQIQRFSGLAWSQQRHVDWVLHSQPSSIALVYSEMRRLARTKGHYEQTQIPASLPFIVLSSKCRPTAAPALMRELVKVLKNYGLVRRDTGGRGRS